MLPALTLEKSKLRKAIACDSKEGTDGLDENCLWRLLGKGSHRFEAQFANFRAIAKFNQKTYLISNI